MADAPAHGTDYGGPGHEDQSSLLDPLIKKCSSKDIKIIGMPIGGYSPLPSFKKCKEQYLLGEGKIYEIVPFNPGSSDFSEYFKKIMLKSIISTVLPQ
jgi:hypothetical protein